MYIQELKDRVARAEYTVDADAVAAAIVRRWHVAVRPVAVVRVIEPPRRSAEVVKSR